MRKRVVVVGGGVVGLACAYSLRERSFDVMVIDAGEIGAGASEGNAGWVTPSLSMPVPAPGVALQSVRWMFRADSPLYIKPTFDPARLLWLARLWSKCNQRAYSKGFAATARLARDTFDLFDRWHEDGVEFEEHRNGLLFLFLDPTKRDAVRAELAAVRSLGYSPVEVDGGELQEWEANASRAVANALWVEQERQVRPETLIAGLCKKLTDGGVEIHPNTPAVAFERTANGMIVRTPAGDITADEVVIAAGAHSGRLARLLGCRLPVDAGKGYSVHHEPAPLQVRHALYLYEARVGVTPFAGALRLAGTMEFSGLNTDIDARRVDAIDGAGRRYLTGWSGSGKGEAWAGMRPMTPDGLPVIGRIAPKVTVASGHAMLGVTLAPVTGEAVGALLADDPPEHLEAFDPGRFTRRGRGTGAGVPVGAQRS